MNKRDLNNEAIAYVNSPICVGDWVDASEDLIYTFGKKDRLCFSKVLEILDNDTAKIEVHDTGTSRNGQIFEVPINKLVKNPLYVGYNPLEQYETMPKLNIVPYPIGSLVSILSSTVFDGEPYYITSNNGEKLKMEDVNWNPYVTDKDGKRQYYQRDFCWSIEEKQQLIESIYKGIDCGKIVVREHTYNEVESKLKKGDKEIAFFDIVDGKQRLNALFGFMNDEFPDSNGKYYSDMSILARRRFENKTVFTFARMDSATTDEEVLKVFLLINFSGRPMSREHLDYVEKILTNV